MTQPQAGATLSKAELAAVDFLIAHLEETNRAHFETDGFIDSISSAISAAASAVSAGAAVIAATAARAATAVTSAVTSVATSVQEAVPAVADATPALAVIGGAAAKRDPASMRDLVAQLEDADLQSQLSLQALVNLRNQYRR